MNLEPDVDVLIFGVTGFGTKRYAWTGIRYILRELDKNYPEHTTEIHYDVWNGSWKQRARRMDQICRPDVLTIGLGHSWGWGRGYQEFADEWARLGREIDLGICIDGVPYRFGLLVSRAINALWGNGPVRAPNTRDVVAFRQVNDRPMGRRVEVGEAATLQQTAFGTVERLSRYAPRGDGYRWVMDEKAQHKTMDEHEQVHTETFRAVASRIVARREGR